jgi:hypothetical protein
MQAKNHMTNNIKDSGSMDWTILTCISGILAERRSFPQLGVIWKI